jgi:hypothetical protein
MVRCAWPIVVFILNVLVAAEVEDRWPHANALSALSARLAAAESEVNATELAMAHCAAELRAERDALAKTRSTVAASEQDVLKGKNALQEAEARRIALRGKLKHLESSEDLSHPAALQSEELEAVSIFTQRVQQEAQELTDAKAKLAEQVKALKARGGNKRSEVQDVKTELERIENRTRVWEADKHALSEALAGNSRSDLQRLPSEKELNELRDLEQIVIPSVTSSISAQEEIVASVMATLNATRYQLRACLESSKSSKQVHASQGTRNSLSNSSNRTGNKLVPQSVKREAAQPTDDTEVSAEQAAAADLDHILKTSSKEIDDKSEEEDVERGLHAELSADEPYKPMITAKSMHDEIKSGRPMITAKSMHDEIKSGNSKNDKQPHDEKVHTPPAPSTIPSVSSKSTIDSHVMKAQNASLPKNMEALKAVLAAPRKSAESLRGKLEHSKPGRHTPSFGAQVAGLMR